MAKYPTDDVSVDAQTHHIGIERPDELIAELRAAGLVSEEEIDDFDDEAAEDADVDEDDYFDEDEDDDDE